MIDPGIPHGALGLLLAVGVGVILGLLGGGGSILALPIFLYVFGVPTKPAVAMSLVVVGMSAFVGFLSHWRQGTVLLRVALPFGGIAMVGAFFAARLAHRVPPGVQLSLFAVVAFTAALVMLRDSLRVERPAESAASARPSFTPVLGAQAFGVGVLTALIGAGGGFLIVPALVLLGKVPVRQAVGSSLLIITLNALSGFAGYVGTVPIDGRLVGWFTGFAAAGTLLGARLVPHVPQRRLKQAFAVLILSLGTFLILTRR